MLPLPICLRLTEEEEKELKVILGITLNGKHGKLVLETSLEVFFFFSKGQIFSLGLYISSDATLSS